ncbi:MAG: hypothetical protein QOG62_114, partial [Thermoleophilaceae bacterium]|nr:hypothetical protein [Thermoleophilaceae bacterium]
KKIKTRKVKFTFASSEAGSTFTCQVDKKSAKPCTSPRRVKLKPGRHTFRVFATDAAGNADAAPAKATFRILKD